MESFLSSVGFENNWLDKKILYVTGHEKGNPSFILPILGAKALKSNSKLLLVSFQSLFTHYINVFGKFSLSLSNMRMTGKVSIVEAGNFLLDSFLKDTNRCSMPQLVAHITETYKKIQAAEGPLIVVDELETLLSLGYNTEAIIQFVQALYSLVHQNGGSLLVLNRFESTDGEATRLDCLFDKWAYVHMSVKGLKTGHSEDLSGSLTVTKGTSSDFLHYVLEERGVKVFAPGTSSAVL